jgi:phospholipid/cholesterol/gamma-HCH transport system substrate-binding protein
VPGGSDKDIPADGKIKYTQSSVSLESLIGQTIFSPGGKKEGGGGGQDNNGQKPPSPQPNSGAPASK